MNKKISVVTCLVAMAVIFSGCSLLGEDKSKEVTKDSKTESKTDTKTESKTEQKNNGGDGNYFETLTDLMERGKSMKCTYTQKIDNENTAEGVVYTADKKARIEIITNKGTAHEGKMYSVTDHEWSYSWVEGSPKGYKMTLEASEMSEKNQKTISKMTDEIDFKCKKWKKDNSKFKVPSNIEFEDMSEMMADFGDVDLEKTIEDAEAESKKFICEHCKNAPASEMAECLGDVVCD